MRTILGIETATDLCSVAVDVDGEVRCSILLDRPRRHAERLVPMIADALAAVALSPDALDAVAVSAGPGSYTGLRIGVSTAKGIALAVGARFVPVPSLGALAWASRAPAGRTVVGSFRSRRQEVYAAAFRIAADGTPQPSGEPAAGVPADVLHALRLDPEDPALLVGEGADLLARILRATGTAHDVDTRVRPSASWVVREARRLASTGDPVDVDRFEPYYLRDFTARPASGSVFDRLPF